MSLLRVFVVLLFAAISCQAQVCPRLEIGSGRRLLPGDFQSNTIMGFQVALDGDLFVTGAYANSQWRGAGYLFENPGGGFRQIEKLVASDASPGNNNGLSVGISGRIVVVGGPFNAINAGRRSGSAYVYEEDANEVWQETRLLPADGHEGAYFGYAVAADGDWVAVGGRHTNNDLTGARSTGAIYMYQRQSNGGWQMVQKLRGTRSATQWADEIKIRNDVLLVGIPRDHGGRGAADVYMFVDGRWRQQQHLEHQPPSGVSRDVNDHFGEGVAIAQDTSTLVVAGEEANSPRRVDTGAAYVYERRGDRYAQVQALFPDRGGRQRFGQRLVARDNVILIGAWGNDDRGTNAGALYIFVRCSDGAWSLQERLYAFGGVEREEFGRSMALSPNTMMVGAPKRSSGGVSRHGAVYVYPVTVRGSSGSPPSQSPRPTSPPSGDRVTIVRTTPATATPGQMFQVTVSFYAASAGKTLVAIIQRQTGSIYLKVVAGRLSNLSPNQSSTSDISFRIPRSVPAGATLRLRVDLRPNRTAFNPANVVEFLRV